MTAQLLEYTTPSDVLVRRVKAARSATSGAGVAHHRPATVRAEERWSQGQARACEVSRPAAVPAPVARPAAVPTRLEWTPRGIAVMVILVALVAGVMFSTMVGAFLAVSNEPAALAPVAVAAAPALPGR